ncbi:MAG: NAD-dependent epimerase/dehydratase family protein [Candidatus Bipolaricaulia bacterium]
MDHPRGVGFRLDIIEVILIHVLLIGGTTFFGKAIAEDLLAHGHQVTLFSRGNNRPPFFDRVEHITGDRSDADDFKTKLAPQTFDAVVDNIAFTADDVRAALDAFTGNVGRYVFTSSAAVYYTGEMTMPVSEDDVNFAFQPPEGEEDAPLWRYTLGKLEAERVLLDQDDLEYTIIRPPIVLGPEDPSLRGYFYFQRLLDERPIILTNGGVQSFRLAYSRDLARGYLRALASERAEHAIYNLNQSEIIQLTDLIETSADALGVEPDIVPIARRTLENAGFEYPETYAPVQNFIPSIEKAQSELSYTTTPFPEWIAQTARWYRDHYQGDDSKGYERRDAEVRFAEAYRQSVDQLAD